MTGKTHYRLGILWYVFFIIVPFIPALPFVIKPHYITLAGIAAAALGGLAPDMDSQHSMINHMNPATGMAYKSIGAAEKLLITMIRLLFTVGVGILIFINRNVLIKQLHAFKNPQYIVYGAVILLMLIGISGTHTNHIPIIGSITEISEDLLSKIASILKRFVTITVYGGIGAYLIYYNIYHWHDTYIYLAGILLISISIFPHRSFLHSLEGLIIFSSVIIYLANKVGFPYLAGAFILGYTSHLYLADMFTNSGVPLSVLPRVLKKIRLHHILEKYRGYSLLYRVLDVRLAVPLMSTGTKSGNAFETRYYFLLALVIAFLFITFKKPIFYLI